MADTVQNEGRLVDEADRLEAALDRIARARARHAPRLRDEADALAIRLDALIAEVRAVLKRDFSV